MPAVALPDAPVAPGDGRVVLEAVDGPAEVSAVWAGPLQEPSHHVLPERPRQFSGRVCTTPCTADLPLGRYDIYFTLRSDTAVRGDHDVLTVQSGSLNVHRRVLGASTAHAEGGRSTGNVLAILGASVAAAGAAVLAGAALTDFRSVSAAPGAVMLSAGGVLAIVGVLLAEDARGTQQEGATTAWLEPLPPPSQVEKPAPENDSANAEESETP